MTVVEMMRDAPVGQLIRWLSGRRLMKYPDELPGFQLHEPWLRLLNEDPSNITFHSKGSSVHSNKDLGIHEQKNRSNSSSSNSSSNSNSNNADRDGGIVVEVDFEKSAAAGGAAAAAAAAGDEETAAAAAAAAAAADTATSGPTPAVPKMTKDGTIIIDWYHSEDPENPHKWSNGKRAGALAVIFFYTAIVYATSAIYTASEEGIRQRFGVSQTKASLGLSVYVLGYGIGPLLFSPLGEIPRVGRNPVYIVTMFLFVVLSIPTAFASNYPGLMVLRFLTGVFGSPCLASGGATVGDMYSHAALPFMMMIWTTACFVGPAVGPLISGFAVPAESWRWSLFESVWFSAVVLIAMFLFLPETNADNILLRRARRIRRLTGSPRFMSQSEIHHRELKTSHVFWDALIKPIEISLKDPAVLFVQVYTAIIYSIYYSFFESFPLVYIDLYGMNYGELGLVFLCMAVACTLAILIYSAYIILYLVPRIMRSGLPPPESRLVPAIPASFGPTIGIFLFAWTARSSIHWIAPTIGVTIYGGSAFIILQCIFVYVPLSYPQYAASLFAANDFFRSALACGSILYADPLFKNLGIGRGASLLGGLSVLGEIGILLLWIFGARLRARSKFAIKEMPQHH